MPLSKKNYQALALILGKRRARAGQPSDRDALSAVQQDISDYLQRENPTFSPEMFAAAVECHSHGIGWTEDGLGPTEGEDTPEIERLRNEVDELHALERTCGCGLYIHPTRRNPAAIHIPDCKDK